MSTPRFTPDFKEQAVRRIVDYGFRSGCARAPWLRESGEDRGGHRVAKVTRHHKIKAIRGSPGPRIGEHFQSMRVTGRPWPTMSRHFLTQ
jgi:hypothetical protein